MTALNEKISYNLQNNALTRSKIFSKHSTDTIQDHCMYKVRNLIPAGHYLRHFLPRSHLYFQGIDLVSRSYRTSSKGRRHVGSIVYELQ